MSSPLLFQAKRLLWTFDQTDEITLFKAGTPAASGLWCLWIARIQLRSIPPLFDLCHSAVVRDGVRVRMRAEVQDKRPWLLLFCALLIMFAYRLAAPHMSPGISAAFGAIRLNTDFLAFVYFARFVAPRRDCRAGEPADRREANQRAR